MPKDTIKIGEKHQSSNFSCGMEGISSEKNLMSYLKNQSRRDYRSVELIKHHRKCKP